MMAVNAIFLISSMLSILGSCAKEDKKSLFQNMRIIGADTIKNFSQAPFVAIYYPMEQIGRGSIKIKTI